MIQLKASLLSKLYVSSDVCLFTFYPLEGRFDFIPGQYVMLSVPGPTPVKRLYSFASAPRPGGEFQLLVKIVDTGVGSEYLKNLPLGAVADFSGPAGLFRQAPSPNKKIYLVTGTGYAPIRSFFLSAAARLDDNVLFWGMRAFEEIYLLDELATLAAERGLQYYYCLSRQDAPPSIPAYLLQHYRTGRISDVWQQIFPNVDKTSDYHICGSRTVVESLRILLLSLGISKDNIFFEKY